MATYNSVIDRTDAGALIPEDAAREIIGPIAESSAVASLARRLPDMARNQRRLPVVASLPEAYFVNGDTGLKQTSEQTWDNVYLNAEELAVIVPIPEAVLDDADYDIWAEMRPHIVSAFGKTFDRAVILGENKPSDWPSSLVDGASGASHVIEPGDVGDLYDDLLGEGGSISKVEEDGYMVNGHIAALSMRAKFRGLRESDGSNAVNAPIFVSARDQGTGTTYALDGEELIFPKNGSLTASDDLGVLSGDWSQLVWAIRQDISYKLLTEAVIQNAAGEIVYNLAQQDMVALRVVFRVGVALPNPTNRVNSNDSTRYPFSIYSLASGGAVS